MSLPMLFVLCTLVNNVGATNHITNNRPGWAGKLCTSISRGNYPTPTCPDFFYSMIGMKFSLDGTRVDVRLAAPWNTQKAYIEHRFNWTVFKFVIFDNYAVNRTCDDAHFLFGLPQSSSAPYSIHWLARLGYQLNGMTFNGDYSRAHFVNSADWKIDHTVMHTMQSFFPPGFFGNYSQPYWIKGASYLTVNGYTDEKNVHDAYFRCVKYDAMHHSKLTH